MSSYSSADDSYDSDEPPELELDLAKLMDCASKALKAKCTAVKKLTRGVGHEVFALQFQEEVTDTTSPSLIQANFSCIARFSRLNNTRAKSASEIATARYLKRFSSIPVPEIYYYDLDPNDIGAPVVLMERIPGRHLNKIWDDLPLDSKKSAISQIASVVAQLSSLKFDQIGSLDEHGGVGPIISPCFDRPKRPLHSTCEYMQSFLPAPRLSAESAILEHPLQQAKITLKHFLAHNDKAYLQPPFCLIHADFDGQNMLFLDPPDGSGPKLTGLIDFEYAFTGPLYFLYE